VRRSLLVTVLALVLTPAAAAATFKATISAPTHTPKVNAKLYYTIHASRNGKPIRATVTVQIVDSFGGVHAVQFDNTTKNIVNKPFTGTFRDYVQLPPESRAFKVTLRAIVRAAGGRITLTWWLKAR
jgi:hypothetical protein